MSTLPTSEEFKKDAIAKWEADHPKPEVLPARETGRAQIVKFGGEGYGTTKRLWIEVEGGKAQAPKLKICQVGLETVQEITLEEIQAMRVEIGRALVDFELAQRNHGEYQTWYEAKNAWEQERREVGWAAERQWDKLKREADKVERERLRAEGKEDQDDPDDIPFDDEDQGEDDD